MIMRSLNGTVCTIVVVLGKKTKMMGKVLTRRRKKMERCHRTLEREMKMQRWRI